MSLKRLLIPLLTSTPAEALGRLFCDHTVPVFMLHRVQGKTAEHTRQKIHHIEACIEYLEQRDYDFLSLEQLITSMHHAESISRKSVVFTMDDGYLDQAELLAPVFLRKKCPLTFFVITSMLSAEDWPWDAKVSWLVENQLPSSWCNSEALNLLQINADMLNNRNNLRRAIQEKMKQLPSSEQQRITDLLTDETGQKLPATAPENYRPMSWELARQLEQQGIQFAPHSRNHVILARMDESSMHEEIAHSWECISKELQSPLKVFCYPNGRPGDFGQREITALQEHGYLGAVSTAAQHVNMTVSAHEYRYTLPRIALPDDLNLFKQYCSWIESIRSNGKLQ